MMFEDKAKEIVKDILKSVHKEDDPIAILLEVYVEKQLKDAYEKGKKHEFLSIEKN